MDGDKVVVEHKAGEKRSTEAGRGRPTLLGWVRKKLRRIMDRKKKELEIYPLF